MTEFKIGREVYYDTAGKLLEDSNIFYVYCKTPTIFMSSQRVHEEQRRFHKKFFTELKRDIDIRYVFSLPYVEEDILNVAKKDKREALSILKEWKDVSKSSRIKLKFIEEKNPFSFLVYDKKTVFLAVYPNNKRGIIIFDNKEVPFFREFFEQIFRKASDNNERAIEKIRKYIKI